MRVYRITLDENFDADLIARIDDRANGSSPNTSLKFLLRYWFEVENDQNLHRSLSESAHEVTTSLQDNDIEWAELDKEF